MQNKGAIILLATVVTLLCGYYLSFTFVASGIKSDARTYAEDSNGKMDIFKRQRYLDSLSGEPVFASYKLKEVLNRELHLGLDLQGGMHVVLEVSPVDILKTLSGNSQDKNFLEALQKAREGQKSSEAAFMELFFEEYEKLAGANQLNKIFAIAENRGRIDFKTPEIETKEILTKEIEGAVDRAEQILRTRVDKFGVTQPNIQRIPGTNRIQIELPGVDNPKRVRKLLQGVAKLEFWEVWEASEYAEHLENIDKKWVTIQKAQGNTPKTDDLADLAGKPNSDTVQVSDNDSTNSLETELTGNESDSSLEDQLGTADTDTTGNDITSGTAQNSPLLSKRIPVQFPGLFYDLKDTMAVNSMITNPKILALLPSDMTFMWSIKPVTFQNGTEAAELNLIKRRRKGGKAPLGGDVIVNALQDFDERGRPAVSMQMNAEGARKWKKLTAKNINRQIAIVLDGYVYSAPNVQVEIGGGQSSISGSFSIEEAQDLANVLKAGKLPAPTTIVEEAVVGPSLGKESIAQGLRSILAGLALVIVFMIIYYARSGLIANVVLLVNIFFIIGVLSSVKAALTLPGIAGIVLTIGMAVDANVLIFERIREELRSELTLTQAITKGYDRAFWSIFDANVTTLLTAGILAYFGTGPIQGFAVTLIIGIVSSFFTAVFVSKVIVFTMIERTGDETKLNFGTAKTMNLLTGTKLDFLGKRKLAYMISAGIIVAGIGAMAAGGLNYGVDFKGGRTYIVQFDNNVVASEVRSALLDDFDNKGTEVKTYDADNQVKITTSYLVEDESDKADETVRTALDNGLKEFADNNPKVLSSSKVGATIADDIKASAVRSTLGALFVIFFYILVRFRKWQFGLGALVALFHDVLIVLSLFAILGLIGVGFEIDQVFVAAILTVVGYSINDTVVVFDRVREFLGLREKGEDLQETLNNSVNSTLSRTLITSVTTLVVVLVLFLFGGEVLRGFSFALLIGLLAGTYSSIFVATPIVADTYKEDPPAKTEDA